MPLQFSSTGNETKSNFTRDKSKNTTYSATADSISPIRTPLPPNEGGNRAWQCEKLQKMNAAERHEFVKKYTKCFSYLNSVNKGGPCKTNGIFGKHGCPKRHNGLFYSDENKFKAQKKTNGNNETSTKADS